jgi:hypothetical protein
MQGRFILIFLHGPIELLQDGDGGQRGRTIGRQLTDPHFLRHIRGKERQIGRIGRHVGKLRGESLPVSSKGFVQSKNGMISVESPLKPSTS